MRKRRPRLSCARPNGLALGTLVALGACSDEATIVTTPSSLEAAPESGANAGAPEPDPTYILSTQIFDTDEALVYVAVLDSLAQREIDLSQAREFAGDGDVWVFDGAVFVASGEDLTITKFSVEAGALVEQGQVSFAAYGLTSFGFWLNTFVSPSQALFLNDVSEYIVWDPSRMQITGTLPLPPAEERPGYRLFPGYSDRAARLVDGLLYQPFYWTDESFFGFLPSSRVVVTDVAAGSVVRVIDAPCPGLDYATADADSNLYFSSWIYAPGGAAVLDQPPTCVFEIPASGEPGVAFDLASVTGGRQGGVMRHVRNGRALLSVLHDERFPPSDAPSVSELTFAANWRFWSYDIAAAAAEPIESIDWNAGAQYSFDIDGTTYMLVAEADYSASTIYDLGDGLSYDAVIETPGWATRLFRLR